MQQINIQICKPHTAMQSISPQPKFINLLDANLQERILNGKKLDIDVKNAMEIVMTYKQ